MLSDKVPQIGTGVFLKGCTKQKSVADKSVAKKSIPAAARSFFYTAAKMKEASKQLMAPKKKDATTRRARPRYYPGVDIICRRVLDLQSAWTRNGLF